MACANTNFESKWYSLWKLRTKARLRPLPTVTTLRVCQLVIETTLDTFFVVPTVLCHISMDCHILLHMIVLMVQQRISINLQIFFHCPITFWINNSHIKKNWHTYSKASWSTPHYLEIFHRSLQLTPVNIESVLRTGILLLVSNLSSIPKFKGKTKHI